MQAWTYKALSHHELAQLADGDLRNEWATTFGHPVPEVTREILLLSLAYHLQEAAHGSLPPRVSRLISHAAREPKRGQNKGPAQGAELAIGTELVREWQGNIYRVVVTVEGYAMGNRIFGSLTEAARHIVGYNYPGPRLFGLRRRRWQSRAVTRHRIP